MVCFSSEVTQSFVLQFHPVLCISLSSPSLAFCRFDFLPLTPEHFCPCSKKVFCLKFHCKYSPTRWPRYDRFQALFLLVQLGDLPRDTGSFVHRCPPFTQKCGTLPHMAMLYLGVSLNKLWTPAHISRTQTIPSSFEGSNLYHNLPHPLLLIPAPRRFSNSLSRLTSGLRKRLAQSKQLLLQFWDHTCKHRGKKHVSVFQSHTVVHSLSQHTCPLACESERASERQRASESARARERESERAREREIKREHAWALHLLRPLGYCRPRLLRRGFLLLLLHKMQPERAREGA